MVKMTVDLDDWTAHVIRTYCRLTGQRTADWAGDFLNGTVPQTDYALLVDAWDNRDPDDRKLPFKQWREQWEANEERVRRSLLGD